MSTNDDNPEKTPRSDEKEIELRRARREQGARERLGPINPKHLKCLYCDVTDPLILEKHHIAGRRYDNDTVIVCRNHHRLLSNFQKDHAAPIYENPHPLENIGHSLEGIADLFEPLVPKFREFAKRLIKAADDNSGNNDGAT